jgi:hypothetical protein
MRNPNTQNYQTNFRNRDGQPHTTPRHEGSGKGLRITDRGDFVAKGFEEAVRVYEVRWRA